MESFFSTEGMHPVHGGTKQDGLETCLHSGREFIRRDKWGSVVTVMAGRDGALEPKYLQDKWCGARKGQGRDFLFCGG